MHEQSFLYSKAHEKKKADGFIKIVLKTKNEKISKKKIASKRFEVETTLLFKSFGDEPLQTEHSPLIFLSLNQELSKKVTELIPFQEENIEDEVAEVADTNENETVKDETQTFHASQAVEQKQEKQPSEISSAANESANTQTVQIKENTKTEKTLKPEIKSRVSDSALADSTVSSNQEVEKEISKKEQNSSNNNSSRFSFFTLKQSVFYSSAGFTVLSAVSTGYFFVQTRNIQNDYRNEVNKPSPNIDMIDKLKREGTSKSTLTNICMIATVTGIIGTATLYYLYSDQLFGLHTEYLQPVVTQEYQGINIITSF